MSPNCGSGEHMFGEMLPSPLLGFDGCLHPRRAGKATKLTRHLTQRLSTPCAVLSRLFYRCALRSRCALSHAQRVCTRRSQTGRIARNRLGEYTYMHSEVLEPYVDGRC
jgi:hypothetical protein